VKFLCRSYGLTRGWRTIYSGAKLFTFFTDRDVSWYQLLQFTMYEHLESPENLVVRPKPIVFPKMRCRIYVILPTVTGKETAQKTPIIKPTRRTNFSNLFLELNYMFRTVPLSIIRSFSLYTQQWYMSYRFVDTLRAGSGRNCSSILISLVAVSKPV